MENNELKAKLYTKITNLANEFGAMKTDGKNDFDHYAFISYQNVNARLRDLLPKYKLAIVPQVIDFQDFAITTSGNKPALRSIVKMSFLLVDTETGYSEERTFVGADQDTKGKSMGQAITECQKRFEMKLFHVSSTEADPDSKSVETSKKPTSTWSSTLNKLDAEFDNSELFSASISGMGYTIEAVYQITDREEQKRVYNKLKKELK